MKHHDKACNLRNFAGRPPSSGRRNEPSRRRNGMSLTRSSLPGRTAISRSWPCWWSVSLPPRRHSGRRRRPSGRGARPRWRRCCGAEGAGATGGGSSAEQRCSDLLNTDGSPVVPRFHPKGGHLPTLILVRAHHNHWHGFESRQLAQPAASERRAAPRSFGEGMMPMFAVCNFRRCVFAPALLFYEYPNIYFICE